MSRNGVEARVRTSRNRFAAEDSGTKLRRFFRVCACFARCFLAVFFFARRLSPSFAATLKRDQLLWLVASWALVFLQSLFHRLPFFFDHFHERFAVIVAIFSGSHFELMLSMSALAMFISRFPGSIFFGT